MVEIIELREPIAFCGLIARYDGRIPNNPKKLIVLIEAQ
jgi:NADPH-dependent curcumin reductase CurA